MVKIVYNNVLPTIKRHKGGVFLMIIFIMKKDSCGLYFYQAVKEEVVWLDSDTI